MAGFMGAMLGAPRPPVLEKSDRFSVREKPWRKLAGPQRHARGALDFPTASVAKLWHPTFEQRSIDRLMQFFGGNGFVAEYPIAHQLAGARADRILGGTDEMMRQAIAYTL